MASTSEELSSQSEQLIGTINFFQLAESGKPAAMGMKTEPKAAPKPAARPGNGHAAGLQKNKPPSPAAGKPQKNGKAGFSLSIGKHDQLDTEFEKY